MLYTNKRFFRTGLRAALAVCASAAFAACSGGTPAGGPLPAAAPADQMQTVVSRNGSTITLTGTVAYMISGGFSIQGGSGVGLLHIYTTSATVFSGAKPYKGEAVEVSGTGSVSTSVTASSVKQLSAPSSTATPSSIATATPAPVKTAAPATVSSSGTAVWRIGNSYVLPASSDGQYQKPAMIGGGAGADFPLVRNYNGTNNYRNQMNPTIGGSLIRLVPGTTYDWKFQTVAKMPSDVNYSQNLIWQIHDYNAGTSPITVLGTQNINDGRTVWYFHGGSGTWKGTYTQGATDTWEIQVKISSSGSGTEKLWRNGALVSSQTGANYSTSSQGYPWWNFGPYEWDWKATHSSGQISNLSSLDFTFNQMTLSKL